MESRINNLKKDIFFSIEQQKAEDTRKFLYQLIDKCFQSSFILPLQEIENNFGELWNETAGPDAELTQEEWEWNEKYEKMRKIILDNGNKQKRILINLLDNFIINLEPRKVVFLNKDQINGNK